MLIEQTMDQEKAEMDTENQNESAQVKEEDEVFTDGARNRPGYVYLKSYQSTARLNDKQHAFTR